MALAVTQTAARKIGSSLGHRLRHHITFIGGKEWILEGHASGFLSGLGGSAPVIGALGAAAALSAGLTQMDYNHERQAIRKLYSDEIASKLKKSVDKLTNKDVKILSDGNEALGIEKNHTIAEALNKSRKNRNFGIVSSVASSLASFSLLLLAINAGTFVALGPIGGILVQAAVGLVAYHAVKEPLNWVGDKVFGLNEKTTHDQIMELQKDHEAGRAISQEQVFSVVVSADPQLSQQIRQRYGKEYDKLDPLTKHQLADQMEMGQITSDINSGKVNATELAFAVEGQTSGASLKADAISGYAFTSSIHNPSINVHSERDKINTHALKPSRPLESNNVGTFTDRLNQSRANGTEITLP